MASSGSHLEPPPMPSTYADFSAGFQAQDENAVPKKRNLFSRSAFKVLNYFKGIATDYAVVFKDLAVESRSRPLKSVIVGGLLAGAVYAYKTNPDEKKLLDELVDLRLQMTLVPNSSHSAKADAELKRITSLLNMNRMDYYNCWLFSLLVQRPYDRKCNLYVAQDPNLRDWPWMELWNNLMDVGAFNRFWLLENKFVDYDVREDEFEATTSGSTP